MPEGHVVHRIAADLQHAFGGAPITSTSPQGRFAAEQLDGLTLVGAEAFGKHLVVSFADFDLMVRVHLGLYGQWSWSSGADVPVTGKIRWRISNGRITADLRGPAVCEAVVPAEFERTLARLGPDPIRRDADDEPAKRRVQASRAPIATLLMDQSVVAGAGNIFRAEVLFRQSIDPLTPGKQICDRQWHRIWNDLTFLMRLGVQRGCIDTVRPEHEPDAMGRAPREDEHGGEVYVYRRAGSPCHVCQTLVSATVLNGRNLFWCGYCQQSA